MPEIVSAPAVRVAALSLLLTAVMGMPFVQRALAQPSVAPLAYVLAERPYLSPNLEEGPRMFAIDMRKDAVVGGPYSLGTAEYQAYSSVISPGGRYVYIVMGRYYAGTPSAYDGPRLAVFDTHLGKIIRSVDLNPPTYPGTARAMSLSPDGGTLYAYRGYDASVGTHAVVAASLPGGDVRGVIPVPFSSGSALAVTPDGKTLVATIREGLPGAGLAFIDTATNAIVDNLELPGQVRDLVFSPDSKIMYVLVGDGQGKLLRVDIHNRVLIDSLPLGTQPVSLAVSPDGRRIYVTDAATPGPGSMFVVNADLWQVATRVFLAPYPGAIAFAPAGDKIYVSAMDVVVVLSAETYAVTNTIDVPARRKIAATPNGTMALSVEFFNQQFGHYFTTNSGIEVDKLDAGDFLGWSRTGEKFGVLTAQTSGAVPVCRYFADTFAGKSSHFYAPRGMGCEEVTSNPDWLYEGDVYYVRLPDPNGSCPFGFVPVYRLYNNGLSGAPNHRFTASVATQQQMVAQGFTREGAGSGVGFCVPG